MCSAGSRQATCRAQQARSALAAVRETAGLAEAKVLLPVLMHMLSDNYAF